MSPGVIAGAIVAIIFGSMIVVYVMQAREKARIDKLRRISQIHDNHRRIYRVLEDLPPQYLNKELRMLLAQRALDLVQDLKKEAPNDPKAKGMEEADNNMLQQLQDNYQKPEPVQVADIETAREIQSLLKTLYKFVEQQKRKGMIPPESAKKYTQNIAWFIHRSIADVYISTAKQAKANGKLRKAIHNYHMAIKEFEKNKNNVKSQKAVIGCKKQIQELEVLAEEENRKKVGIADSDQAEAKEGSSEWKEIMDEEDPWKKKQDYDV